MKPTILALDLSLTATGVDYGEGPKVMHTRFVGVERLAWFVEQVRGVVALVVPDVAVVEGYSYASANQGPQCGELGGVVRLALYDLAVPFVIIPPSSLKKWLTDCGNAGKDKMVATAARLGCPADNNNAVDAWALRQMALYAYGCSDVLQLAYRDLAVAKIVWPVLAVRGVA